MHNHICTKQTNPCVVLPAGSGKSVVMANLVNQWVTQSPCVRGAVLAHRKELVEQNHGKLCSAYPGGDIGIFSAGLGRRDYDSQITFASIDSIFRRAGEFRPFDFLFIDEAHRIPPKGEGKYRTFISECRNFNPKLRVLMSGCGEKVKRLREFDDSLNPPSLGIYPGQKFAPEVLYAAADLLVLPATQAVSPLPLLRAAQAHLPVVASNSQAFREYLRHEQNALLFGPGVHNAGDPTCRRIRPLATAVVRLLENGKLAKQLGSKLQAPFMTLSFMALLVIPKIKLSDKGLFDGEKFEFMRLFE